VPGQGALQLAQDGVGRPRRGRVIGARQQDHDLRAHGLRPRGEHGGGAGQHGARAAVGHAEHALAPAVLGGHERVRAGDDDARPLDEVEPQFAARPRMSSRPEMSRSSRACRKPVSACSEARSGARRRSTSEAIRVVTS
jgi:hypothetical protein